MNVCVGAYRDENGKPWILPSASFVQQAIQFANGQDPKLDNIEVVQTLSGTGACSIGGEFLSRFVSSIEGETQPLIYVPNPTWGNHLKIITNFGLQIEMIVIMIDPPMDWS